MPKIMKPAAHQKTAHSFFKRLCLTGLILLIFLPLVINDKPILIFTKENQLLFPQLESVTWTQLGASRDIAVDFEDPQFQRLSKNFSLILWPFFRVGPWSEGEGDVFPLTPQEHPIFGTDINGHDLVVHSLYGLRILLFFGAIVTLLSGLVGVIFGMLQGFYKGRVDFFIQRLQEIMSGIPLLYILMLIQRAHQPSLWMLIFAVVPLNWFVTARIMRVTTFKFMAEPFMQNARFLGISKIHQLFLFLFPLLWGSLKRWFPMLMTGAISILLTLDILGFGLAQDVPSLGRLIMQGKNNLDAPWILCVPIGMIIFTVFAIILWGQGPANKPQRRDH